MPSGLELKPTRLMPLTERSECREVLLLECGAPAREPPGQREPRAAWGRAGAPCHVCAGAWHQGCSGPPLLQVLTRHRAAGCPAQHSWGCRHAAPLRPGSAVCDLLPVPTMITSTCTSRHCQQPWCPSSCSSTACVPQH